MSQERLRADVWGSIRLLRTDSVQSLLIISVLSLGIGASLAVFSAVDLAFLRPLPYPDGDQLVLARMLDRRTSQTGEFTPYPVYEEWKRQASSVASFAAYLRADATLTESGHPQLIQTARVDPDFFRLLGVRPLLGQRSCRNVGTCVQVPTFCNASNRPALRQAGGSNPALAGSGCGGSRATRPR
jgi:putative ABC transport system permease protein